MVDDLIDRESVLHNPLRCSEYFVGLVVPDRQMRHDRVEAAAVDPVRRKRGVHGLGERDHRRRVDRLDEDNRFLEPSRSLAPQRERWERAEEFHQRLVVRIIEIGLEGIHDG